MNKTQIQLTDDHKKRLLRIAKVADAGDMALMEEVFNLEHQIELVVRALNDGLQYAVKIAETTQKLQGPPGKPGEPGTDGNDYVLTADDKSEIARKIKVPVVEKVIEKTVETIKEVPVVSEKIIETIREEKLPQEALDEINQLKGIVGELKATIVSRNKTGSGSRPIRVFNNGTEVSQNVLELNFTNASSVTTTGQVGRRVNITTGSSFGAWSTPAETPLADGSVTQYTVGSSAPTDVLADGIIYPSGTAWTFSGTKITLNIGGAGPTQFVRFR